MPISKKDTARDEALLVLRRLRDGIDPRSGAEIAPDHLCQRADVVRALFAAVDALESVGATSERGDAPTLGGPAVLRADTGRPSKPRPLRSGQPWSEADDGRLVEAFDGGADERELAALFGRSRTSIRARLVRLGRGALLGDGPAPRYPVLGMEAPLGGDHGVNEDVVGDVSQMETMEIPGPR
ncbi:MAG: hypothetical protein K8T90_21995 [Planctomycetes bacterium]|nr:hypothetical protein [Planctomycetota bacterium]